MEMKYNKNNVTGPIVSKLYCSRSQTVVVVRRRPHVVNGGGFVVTDFKQNVLFRVDGCGVLGTKGQLIVRDGNGDELLIIRKKGGMVQALSVHNKWRGYSLDCEGTQKPVFTLKDPKNSCLAKLGHNAIRGAIESSSSNREYFEIKGYFPDRACSIVDSSGNTIAQIGSDKEVKEIIGSTDLYHVVIKPGVDQAFVFGVIAVLDYIYGESTRC